MDYNFLMKIFFKYYGKMEWEKYYRTVTAKIDRHWQTLYNKLIII